MTALKNYEYKGDCRFAYEGSYFECDLIAELESSEHNLSGVCSDEKGVEYNFSGQKD